MQMSDLGFEMTAIRVSTLRGDLKIPFDAFVRIGGKYILYCRKGDSFEGARLERLKSKKLDKMFIRRDDEIPYRQYLESSIDDAYNNLGKSIEIRAEVIQGFQQAEAEQYMEAPTDQLSYEHVRSSVHRFIGFLQEPKAFRAILNIKNIDQSIGHHGVNVASIATLLARKAHPQEGTPIALMALGALLHDIEHTYERFNVSKPLAEMTRPELETYKQHPLSGAKRLQQVSFVDQLVYQIISQHEEAMDGTGFPQGLLHDKMDPLILVVGTANAYDRLISFEGKEPKEALKHLLIDKMGVYPLPLLQGLQEILKAHQIV